MFKKIPLKYFLFANLPICVLGLAIQVSRAPLRIAMPIAIFQIAFAIVLVARCVAERRIARAKTQVADRSPDSI